MVSAPKGNKFCILPQENREKAEADGQARAPGRIGQDRPGLLWKNPDSD
jgi:hypothetical protein